ncbi:1-phosphofructokinase [Ruminococcaceae bacterium OttesenSCG-928-A16]|nr:1-phosphofructokinase [Ruminococcaceae bacterium OttesenSCG-928-A16]
MIYTVTFNPAVDYIVQLNTLQPGAINRAQSAGIQFGGKGINVAVLLQNLGVPTTALGFVAGFTGAALQASLHQAGIKANFIGLPAGHTRINVKVKAGEETEINGPGPAIPQQAIKQLLNQLSTLAAGDILVLAGSVPPGVATTVYSQIMASLPAKATRVVVDATDALLANTLPHHPFLIKPNLAELSELAGRPLHTQPEVAAAAKQLQQRGARNVLVSLAGNGALLLDETGELHTATAPKGVVVNSAGAGDAMVAGFLAGYLTSESYPKALQMGIAAGSATAFAKGMATKGAIDALLKEMQTE